MALWEWEQKCGFGMFLLLLGGLGFGIVLAIESQITEYVCRFSLPV